MSLRPPPDPMASMWAWLAHDLRFHREKQGLTGTEVGKIIRAVRSTVSRIESGDLKIDDKQAAALDKAWNTGGHFLRLLTYAKLGHDPNWFKSRLDKERDANLIKAYEGQLVPGLLQTPEYAAALITARFSGAEAQYLIDERMARQQIFAKEPPPALWAILDECVLLRRIGGREVTKAQFRRLLELSELPNMAIRIVPLSAGYHDGLDGPFDVISTETGTIAYASAPGGGRLVAATAEVQSFSVRYDRIGHEALPAGASRDLINKAMEDL